MLVKGANMKRKRKFEYRAWCKLWASGVDQWGSWKQATHARAEHERICLVGSVTFCTIRRRLAKR